MSFENIANLLDLNDIGVVVYNDQLDVIVSNSTSKTLFGYDFSLNSELIPMSWNAQNEDGSPFLLEHHPVTIVCNENTHTQKTVFSMLYPIENRRKWISVTATVEPAKSERNIIVLYSDVSETYYLKDQVNKLKSELYSFYEKSPVGVAHHTMVYDEFGHPVDFYYDYANQKFEDFTGSDPTGRTVKEVFPGIEKDPKFDWIGTCGEVAKTGESIRFQQYLEPVDRWYDIVVFQSIKDHFIVAFLDITDIKIKERELEESKIYIKNIIDSISSVIVSVDDDCNILQCNKAGYQSINMTENDIFQKPLQNLFPRVKAFTEKIKESIGTGVPFSDQIRSTNGDGEECVEKISVYPLISQTAKGGVVLLDDFSESHQLQQKLNHMERLDSLGQLAGGIAHDFNNMLGGIISSAEILKLKLPPIGDHSKYLSLIMDSANRASELSKKLLVFSKQKPLDRKVISIHQLVNNTYDILLNTIDKRICLKKMCSAEVDTVVGDESQLSSLLLNMGLNGTHAMGSGGTLIFSTKNLVLDENYCTASSFDISPGPFLEITVEDTGCGIPTEHLNRIFEPFFTTKEQGKGTGLGLSSAFGAIKKHKGEIQVYSEVNEGTRFRMLLPLTDEIVNGSLSDQSICYGSGTVLLVDDEEAMRVTGKTLLEEFGYRVITAVDGLDGIEAFRKGLNHIDIVVCDMVMPNLNGMECFDTVKKMKPDIKFIIASGFTGYSHIDDMKEKGLDGFISKPFNAKEFSEVIYRVLYQ